MNTKQITTKTAKDGPEFEPYPTYSMGILWNLDAERLNETVDLVGETPLDGDAMARRACQTKRLAESWMILDRVALDRLRNNGEIDRNNR
jgi:hypothetical protein